MEEKFVKKSKDIAARVIEGKAIIVKPAKGTSYVLNAVGTQVWQLSDGKRTVKEIIAEICKEFDVGKEKAKKDVGAFIENLQKEGIIELKAGEKEK